MYVILQVTISRDCVDCVVYIIMKALNGFLITQRQMTLKDECVHIMLVNFIGHVFRTPS